jgi:hypothetical protein
MKSTTVRFADPVYRDLETASRLTGLPINSIVTVACLEWLRRNLESEHRSVAAPRAGLWPLRHRPDLRRELVELVAGSLGRPESLWPFTLAARDALSRAADAAVRARRPWIGTGHLLEGLAEAPGGRAAAALASLRVDAASVAGAESGAESGEAAEGAAETDRLLPTRQVRQVMRHAQEEADREGAAQMGTDHLLLGLLLAPDSRVAEPLAAAGATDAAVRAALRDVAPEE